MEVDSQIYMDQAAIVKTLQLSRFFSKVSHRIVERLASAVEIISLDPDSTLFKKGDAGQSMYIVHSGMVKVHDGEMIFNFIGEGEFFGEMALFDNEHRSASISAVQDTVLVKLNKSSLDAVICEEPEMSGSIIRSLCHQMRDRVKDISKDYKHINRLETELKIGRKIQSGFLPEKLPEVEGWEISYSFNAARECAGDFYDAFIVESNGRLAFVIADVADKGVGAALFMTLIRSLLRSTINAETYSGEKRHRCIQDAADKILQRTISITNNYIALNHGNSNMFATLFFALVDIDTGKIDYVNCGHEEIEIIGNGEIKYELGTTGPVVGLFPDAYFEVKQSVLEKGDTLFGYTDGVTEAMNVFKEQYGMDRLRNYLRNNDQSAYGLLSGLEEDIWKFTLGEAQSDDITMLSLKRN